MSDHSTEALITTLKKSNITSLLSALADGKTLIDNLGNRIALRDGAIRYVKRDGSHTNEIISATNLFTFDDEIVTWTVDESEIDFLRSLLVTVNAARFSDSQQRWPIHQQIHRRIETLVTAK
jgi:hypothetical protein